MKRIIALLLSTIIIFTSCTQIKTQSENETISNEVVEPVIEFENLSDPELLPYLESTIYTEVINRFDSENYFVENVQAIYISQEYIDEITYNSQSNIYFGYTLEELDAAFEGTRYVFTVGEDGKTTVKEFEKYDDTFETVIKNITVGTGVILICVTVSLVAAPAAPAVSLVFAAAAKTGTVVAVSDGVFSGVTAGVVEYIETGDFDEALKSAALVGSDGFKWGAIGGSIAGGTAEYCGLLGATKGGLTLNEVATIQKESKLPLEFIKSFHSVDEYEVYKKCGLDIVKIDGKWAYIQDIDWDFEWDGMTNKQRVINKIAPVDNNGNPYELHHIGQKNDSPIAILTKEQHHSNHGILHKNLTNSEVDHGYEWEQAKDMFWKGYMLLDSVA